MAEQWFGKFTRPSSNGGGAHTRHSASGSRLRANQSSSDPSASFPCWAVCTTTIGAPRSGAQSSWIRFVAITAVDRAKRRPGPGALEHGELLPQHEDLYDEARARAQRGDERAEQG